jgi:hypothetical protein
MEQLILGIEMIGARKLMSEIGKDLINLIGG